MLSQSSIDETECCCCCFADDDDKSLPVGMVEIHERRWCWEG